MDAGRYRYPAACYSAIVNRGHTISLYQGIEASLVSGLARVGVSYVLRFLLGKRLGLQQVTQVIWQRCLFNLKLTVASRSNKIGNWLKRENSAW